MRVPDVEKDDLRQMLQNFLVIFTLDRYSTKFVYAGKSLHFTARTIL